jgi:hypothetical protein
MAPRKRNVDDVLAALPKGEGAKNVFVRVDFNVPMDGDGRITDDSRIKGAIPTIEKILKSGNNAILMSHMYVVIIIYPSSLFYYYVISDRRRHDDDKISPSHFLLLVCLFHPFLGDDQRRYRPVKTMVPNVQRCR